MSLLISGVLLVLLLIINFARKLAIEEKERLEGIIKSLFHHLKYNKEKLSAEQLSIINNDIESMNIWGYIEDDLADRYELKLREDKKAIEDYRTLSNDFLKGKEAIEELAIVKAELLTLLYDAKKLEWMMTEDQRSNLLDDLLRLEFLNKIPAGFASRYEMVYKIHN